MSDNRDEFWRLVKIYDYNEGTVTGEIRAIAYIKQYQEQGQVRQNHWLKVEQTSQDFSPSQLTPLLLTELSVTLR